MITLPLTDEELMLIRLGKIIYFSLYVDNRIVFKYKIVGDQIYHTGATNYTTTGFKNNDIFEMLSGKSYINLENEIEYRIHRIFETEEEIEECYRQHLQQEQKDGI